MQEGYYWLKLINPDRTPVWKIRYIKQLENNYYWDDYVVGKVFVDECSELETMQGPLRPEFDGEIMN